MRTTSTIRSVIVEDEETARTVLRNYIAKYCPQVTLVGEAANIKEAVPLLHKLTPDLVFLDVEMPFGNAFDVLDACKELSFETIFVTAFSEYSLKALNQSAAYYLLKPLSIEELLVAVNKVHEQLKNKDVLNRNQIVLDNYKTSNYEDKQIILPTMEGFEVIKMKDVVRVKGNGNFSDIHLIDGSKKMVCRFLKHFTEILSDNFVRVHKSHIINIHCVKSYNKGGYITLQNEDEVELSSTYKDKFLQHFN